MIQQWNKQMQPLTGNGAVNMFPQQQSNMTVVTHNKLPINYLKKQVTKGTHIVTILACSFLFNTPTVLMLRKQRIPLSTVVHTLK
jgi:hypothetical protein